MAITKPNKMTRQGMVFMRAFRNLCQFNQRLITLSKRPGKWIDNCIYSRRSGKVVQGGEPQTVQIVRQGEPTP